MGLLIKATDAKPIKIAGTEIDLLNVYGRIEFAGRADGKTLEIAVVTYASKDTYIQNMPLYTDVQQGSFTVEIYDGSPQSINTALNCTKTVYENLGYNVEIIL
jgi:hypothetical protein